MHLKSFGNEPYRGNSESMHRLEPNMRGIRKIYFDGASDVPNSTLPVLLYRSVLPLHATGKSSAFRERFKGAGWTGIWTTRFTTTPTSTPTPTKYSASRKVR